MRSETSALGVTNLLIKILLAFSIISFSGINYIGNTFADATTGSGIKVTVTEKIPGANCNIPKDKENNEIIAGVGQTQMYECTVEKGFGSVTAMLGKIIKYFTYIAALGGVLFIVINGILYSMGGADDSFKTESKKRIIGTLIGLVVLMLSGVILNAIAPWIYVGS